MKKLGLIISVLIFSFTESGAQCSRFFDFQNGTSFERESYNSKDKITGKSDYKIESFKETSEGYSAKLNMNFYDEKGKNINNAIIDIECNGGTYEMDMKGIIPQETFKMFESMETTINMENVEYPADLKVGQKLENGFIEIKASSPIPLSLRVDMVNRNVESKEKITTSAGTFDCFKISYQTDMKTIFSISSKGVDYIAPGVGLVKTETFKPNGKLSSYTLLTKYSK